MNPALPPPPLPECDKVLLVQAELDGELGAAEAAALAAHQADCPICQAAATELAQARALIGSQQLYRPMPDDVRTRVMAQVAAMQRSSASPHERSTAASRATPLATASARWRWPLWWSSLGGFGVGAACAAALALLLVVPRGAGLTDQVVASHIRALQPGHLEDVPSTDQHTVKPWFDGRIDFAPPVKDLAAEHYPLKGGRLDYLDGRPVAALVYQRDKHLIDLYVWPSSSLSEQAPESTQVHGYNVVHWQENGMNLWAVSDLEAKQLRQFSDDWRRLP